MTTSKIQSIFTALSNHQVNYILVGSLGAVAHGAHLKTADVDICIATDSDNLKRIALMLRNLDAQLLREPPRGFAAVNLDDWQSLRLDDATEHHLFATAYGEVDVLPALAGASGYGSSTHYEQLRPAAVTVISFGLSIQVAAFSEIMASKLAISRPQDQAAETELRRVAARLQSNEPPDYDLEQFALESDNA